MAIHAHSTPVPAPQRGLLRAFAHPCDLAANHREISGSCLPAQLQPAPAQLSGNSGILPVAPLADPENTAAQSCSASGLAPEEALASTALTASLPAPLPSLTSAFSRRRAIFGAVALAAAPVAIAPAAAVAGDFPSTEKGMSAEAGGLQAEFQSVLQAYQAAGERHEEAEAAFVYVEAPDALYARPGDAVLLGFRSPVRSFVESRRWYAEQDLIDDLRAASFRYMSGRVDERAVARRDEIVGAWDRWLDDTKAAEDTCGYTASYEAWVVAQDAYHDFRSRLVDLRTTDRDVMALKARVVLERASDIAGIDDMLTAAMNTDGIQQEAMAMSLVRDFIGQLGGGHRKASL